MNKIRIILQYFLGIIISLLLTVFILTFIFKKTISQKEFLKNTLEKTNYYETIYKETYEEMRIYMISSGLPEEVLKDIYTKKEIKKDVNTFIDYFYEGKKIELDKTSIKNKLMNNIQTYLSKNYETITHKEELSEFISDIEEIYRNEVCLYHTLDSFIKFFHKGINYINFIIDILFWVISILFILECLLKTKFMGAIISSSGINILLIIFLVYEKVDYKNLLIISEYFSKVIREIFQNIIHISIYTSTICIIIGLLLSFICSFEKKKSKRQQSLINND